jgi:predicted kinase
MINDKKYVSPVLIILQGIPSSGKTTWARTYIKKRGSTNAIIVNRDAIRSMLGDYWVPKREYLVTDIEEAMVKAGLEAGYTVILDATNLNEAYLSKWVAIAAFQDASIMFKKFHVKPYIAIWRDFLRGLKGGRRVGRKVIMSFYNRYKDKLSNG